MYSLTVFLFFTIVIATSFADEHHKEEHHVHPKYEFKYGVKDEHTHDIKEQHEKRDGDKVEGHYMLVEADGTIRTVHYTADKHTGFHAHVQREGHAMHQIHQEKKMEVHHEEVEIPNHEMSHHEHMFTATSYANSHHEKKMEIHHEKKMEIHHKKEEKPQPKSHEEHKFTATSYANSHLH